MIDGPEREMTLDEWMAALPESHDARRQLDVLRARLASVQWLAQSLAAVVVGLAVKLDAQTMPDDLDDRAAVTAWLLDVANKVGGALKPPAPSEPPMAGETLGATECSYPRCGADPCEACPPIPTHCEVCPAFHPSAVPPSPEPEETRE